MKKIKTVKIKNKKMLDICDMIIFLSLVNFKNKGSQPNLKPEIKNIIILAILHPGLYMPTESISVKYSKILLSEKSIIIWKITEGKKGKPNKRIFFKRIGEKFLIETRLKIIGKESKKIDIDPIKWA